MTTLLAYGDGLSTPEIRHEIGEPLVDPVVFIEHDGRRIVVASLLEEPILAARDDVVDEVWTFHDLGSEDLARNDTFPAHLIGAELALRALERLGAAGVGVPPALDVAVADHLRGGGIDVAVAAEEWASRRRRKTPAEIEGIERAQRAAETAMLTAARMLRDAEPTAAGALRFEGEVLTAELIREAMEVALVAQGASSDGVLVQSGDAWTRGHDPGRGPVVPGATCIVDCTPRDRRSGCHADMTRTFVPGRRAPDAVVRLHRHCVEALEIALAGVAPGADDLFRTVSDYFDSHGFPTRVHSGPGPLKEGFFHALGHGVGLGVHERPLLGLRSDGLVEGDVIALEPGLYFEGVGGVRVEDTVIVTADGYERITDAFPYGLEP